MIIYNKPVQGVNKTYNDTGAAGRGTKTTAATTLQRPDELILSPQAQEIRQAVAQIKDLPEVRQEKVDEIAQKIADGSYNVEARNISDAIWTYFRKE
ncbi:MAG TPA: flagellar biosynthesis anti-sigma factor FlgM [Patescibacteria group bacterium]|nr:flagellar biosynthesis anti-sigma factor FlgM [Patescibacteria group bacterium]